MKIYANLNDLPVININRIVSIVLTGDIDIYAPRNYAVYGSGDDDNFTDAIYGAKKKVKLDYSQLTSEQLLQLPQKELSNIHDIRILRKLPVDKLTVQQKREVTQANKSTFKSPKSEVDNKLSKIRDCGAISVWRTLKNNEFTQELRQLGIRLTDNDAYNVISLLSYNEYQYSTLSYVDANWCNLLMVFRFDKPYEFTSTSGEPVVVKDFDIYIKIDVDNETEDGYAAMSFHRYGKHNED